MILAVIYQAVLEELMLAKKDSAKTTWEMLQTMHVGVELVEEAKVSLKSEFEAICMKDGESINDCHEVDDDR